MTKPVVKHFGPMAVRLAALILFGVSVYSTEYPKARANFFETGSRLGGTIAALNVGKFFYFYSGDETDTPEN